MRGGYESLVWINDKDGREYVCYSEDINSDKKSFEELSRSEQQACENVNNIVGTERW